MDKQSFNIRRNDILVVDDDTCYQKLLSIFLTSQGVAVSTTSGGIEALEILKHSRFKMIITDCNMPGMDGLELAANVREQHPGTPVVMVTGTNKPDVIEAAVKAGISKVISKPIDLRTLMEAVTSCLHASHNTVSA